MRKSVRAQLSAIAVVLTVAVAACGSDKKSESTTATTGAATTVAATTVASTAPAGGASTTTAGGTATTAAGGGATTTAGGSTASGSLPRVKGDQKAEVMVITDVTPGQIAYTAGETYPAVQAAFADFPNVTVKVCDSKGDPNEYLNCQRTAVSDKAAAVIIGFVAGGAAGEDVLYSAGIPVLGGTAATNNLAYGIASGLGGYAGLGAASAASGCTDIGTLYLEGTDQLADMIKTAAASQGVKEVSRAAIPANAPDLAPAIAKLLGDKAKCIILSVAPPMVVQAMTAISQSGEKPMVAAVGAILPPQIIQALGPMAEGMIAIEQALSSGSDAPVLTELQTAMAKFDPKAPITVQSNLGFVAGELAATAISQISGDVTPAAVVTKLNALRNVDMGGIVPPVNIEPLTNPALTRYMNPWAIAYAIKDGKPTAITGQFVDLKPAIDG